MKGILEFNLDDSSEEKAFFRAAKATDLALTLWDLHQWLRSQIKYETLEENELTLIEKVRDQLLEIELGHGIDVDELLD